jgi:hypothetical protein
LCQEESAGGSNASEGVKKFESVMLSAAKHLHYLLEKKEMQMLRCAQHDRAGRFFHTF